MGVFRRKMGKVRRILLQPEEKWELIKKQDPLFPMSQIFKTYDFKTILDIGANEGQFAKKARQLYPVSQLYSFEPIPLVYDLLKANFIDDPSFVAYNCALGDISGDSAIYMNEFSASSSLLKMAEHKEHFVDAVKETEIPIKIRKLDEIFIKKEIEKPILIKVDVQGFELQVIEGGISTISNADVLIFEVSFRKLYEGQVLFHDIYERLLQLGFNYRGNIEQLYSPKSGEILQADAVFIKE